MIRYPDRDSVAGWHNSPAYQALVSLHNEAADVDVGNKAPWFEITDDLPQYKENP